MKLKIKKEYIILGTILVLLLGYYFLFNRNKTHYRLPKINKIANADIKKIVIKKPGEDITLKLENDKWYIIPEKYPVNQAKIDEMLKIITGFTLTDLISESKNYTLYELDDEKKINIKAYTDDDKILREFDMGKTADTHKHTFVKLINDPDVYYAKENFKPVFNIAKEDIRDKTVMKFDKNQINLIFLDNKVEKLDIMKESADSNIDLKSNASSKANDNENPPKDIWKTGAGKVVNADQINGILETLSNLNCEDYIYGKVKTDYTKPIYSVTLKGTKEYNISIYEKEGEKYPATSTENDYPFLLSDWKAERIMKKYDELFK